MSLNETEYKAYSELKKENQELKAKLESECDVAQHFILRNQELEAEIERLKKENERLYHPEYPMVDENP